jgi:hypothetical protein
MQHCVYIGPDKAGSTWFYDTVRSHPQVATPRAKELFFFDRYHHLGVKWYLEQYEPLPRTALVRVDVSHDYLFDPEALRRLHDFDPDTIIYVGLREPLSRAVSAHAYMMSQGRTALPFSTAVQQISELLEHGQYGRLLAPWVEVFGSHNFRYLLFDDIVEDEESAAEGVFRGMGLHTPSGFIAPGNRNPARVARKPATVRVLRHVGNMIRHIGRPQLVERAKRSFVVRRILFRAPEQHERTVVDSELSEEIVRSMTDDVMLASEITGIDLVALWGYGEA